MYEKRKATPLPGGSYKNNSMKVMKLVGNMEYIHTILNFTCTFEHIHMEFAHCKFL